VGGRFGDQAVVDVYRQSLRYGFEGAIRRVLDITTDQLSKDWAASIKGAYLPLLAGRTAPDSTGTAVIRQKGKRGGEYNTSPVLSPDGRSVAFFSSRGLFGIDLYVADAETGRVRKQLSSINTPRHFDALSFINSAGSWSPDGRRLVYLVYREGNQELEIYDLDRGRNVKRLRTPGIGAAVDPAWSPDGRYIAFAGHVGGISDLFLYDLETDRVEQLTNDREAQLQPAWSPDGRTLAFATDAGPGTSLERLTFAPMRLATMDVAARSVRLLAAFPGARHINPAWSPDGRSLYFVADPDGFSDVYRMELATGARFRLTRTATGVSGITSLTPALSVARETGRVVFSVFDRGGYHINRFEAGDAVGTPVEGAGPATTIASSGGTGGNGGVLPPANPARASLIDTYLADAGRGLPRDTAYAVAPYSPRLRLDFVAPPSVGVGYSNQLGAVAGGGIAAAFSDQLGNQNVTAVAQVQGQLQDFGGQVFYTNTRRRWNWGGGVGHIPYLTGGAFYEQDAGGNLFLTNILQRIYVDQASLLAQYPLNPTQRFELTGGVTRQSYGVQAFRSDRFGNTERIDESELPFGLPPAVTYAQASAAFVGDYSVFGLTSPIAGARYRFEATPTLGQMQFTTATADYRRYWLARPVTFAVRGLHFGRYGRDAEDSTRIAPIYAGFAQFIRGYDVGNNLAAAECAAQAGSCPVFDRLIGSRLAVASAELRIPLLGVEGLGLIRTNLVPVEIAPFFDAAMTWRGGQSPDLRWVTGDAARAASRIPVFSTGVTARINLLGYAVVEAFYAIPFQRPDKGGHFGFQLAPGW
jgi:Tol biopolymer transport system component